MWKNFLDLSLSPLNLVLRATVVYLAILLLLRLSGKKQVGQLGAVELVTILLISNAVQNSMNGGDNSLVGGLILSSTLVALSSGLSWLTFKSRTCEAIFEGTPTLLVHEGKRIESSLKKELLTHAELSALMRKQGVHDVKEVKSAVLEADGTLSIVRFQDLA